jgi:hypothetical protein
MYISENFTELEKKLLLLAMDPGAPQGERDAASAKLMASLRKRFPSGHEFLEAAVEQPEPTYQPPPAPPEPAYQPPPEPAPQYETSYETPPVKHQWLSSNDKFCLTLGIPALIMGLIVVILVPCGVDLNVACGIGLVGLPILLFKSFQMVYFKRKEAASARFC